MAKKIRSWEEYDRTVQERQERFEEEVEAELEQIIRPAIKKQNQLAEKLKKRVGGVAVGFVREGRVLTLGIDEFIDDRLNEYPPRLRAQHQQEAEQKVQIQHFQENLGYLVHCGTSRAQRGLYLSEADKEQLYSRLVKQINSFVKNNESLRQEIPETASLTQRFLYPDEKEQGEKIKKITSVLKRKRYLTSSLTEAVLALLTAKEQVPVTAPALSVEDTVHPNFSSEAPPFYQRWALERKEVHEQLTILYGLSPEISEHYAPTITLHQLEEMQRELSAIVGEEWTVRLIQSNPQIISYAAESYLTKYIKTLRSVHSELEKAKAKAETKASIPNLEQRFGLEQNIEKYASIDSLLGLKRELFTATGSYAPVEEPQGGRERKEEFDVEQYKDRLLQKAGLDVDLVRGYTEGKTAFFKGEMYMPKEYFRKNAGGKVEPAQFSAHWEEVFDEMVRLGAIVRKPKGNPLYHLNPHFGEITNKYLQEYMRLTLHAEQILAQEGQITPLIDLDAEDKPKP